MALIIDPCASSPANEPILHPLEGGKHAASADSMEGILASVEDWLGSPQPVFVWSCRQQTLLWCNAAAAALYEVGSRQALYALPWADTPLLQQMGDIWRSLPANGTPRLECLRMTPPGRSLILIVQARRLTSGAHTAPLQALLTVGQVHISAGQLVRIQEPAPLAEAPVSALDAADPLVNALWHRVPVLPALTPEKAAPEKTGQELAIASEVQPVAAPIAPPYPVRFLWRSDWHGALLFVSPEFQKTLKTAAGSDTALSVAQFFDADNAALMQALQSQQVWADIEVFWPANQSIQPSPSALIRLSATPFYDEAGDFEGYNGFGIISPHVAITPHVALSQAAAVVQKQDNENQDNEEHDNEEQDNEDLAQELPVTDAPIRALPLSMPIAAQHAFIAETLSQKAGLPAGTDLVMPIMEPSLAGSSTFFSSDRDNDNVVPWPVRMEAATKPTIDAVHADALGGAVDASMLAAQERANHLQAMLDAASDGVVLLDAHCAIVRLTASAELLLGRASQQVAGAPFVQLFMDDSHGVIRQYLNDVQSSSKNASPLNHINRLLHDGREVMALPAMGGAPLPLFLTLAPLKPTAHEPSAVICAVLRDISQWKKAEETLTDARKEAELASSHKSDFLAKISHEIRTPLNAIIGFSEVMIEEHFGPIANERYKGYLRDIHASGTHLVSLVNDLLDLSKIESGKMELTPISVSLQEVVQQSVALMQPQANRDGVILRTSLAMTPNVVADERSIRQILLNLLSNAIRFSRSGGQVIISTLINASGEVSLRVRDQGIGMSEKEIAIALEPFRQVSALGRHGTGLGLPLTKALAEANRATFEIESTSGSGTMVQITFPATRVLAE